MARRLFVGAALAALSLPAAAQTQAPAAAQPLIFQALGEAPKCSGDLVSTFYEKAGDAPGNAFRRHLHPTELELDIDLDQKPKDTVRARLQAKDVSAVPSARKFFTGVAASNLNYPVSQKQLTPFEARFLYCRMERLGARATLFARLDELQRDPKYADGSAFFWSSFIHEELNQFINEAHALPAKGPVDYKTLSAGLKQRTTARLDKFLAQTKDAAAAAAAAVRTPTGSPVVAAPGDPQTLSAEDLNALPPKLRADYVRERIRAKEQNPNDPAKLAAAMAPINAEYSKIAAAIRALPEADRTKLAGQLDAAKDAQARQDVVFKAFPKLFAKNAAASAQGQLKECTDASKADLCFSGNTHTGSVVAVPSLQGPTTGHFRQTEAEAKAEAANRKKRNANEAAVGDDDVPSPTATNGDVDPNAGKDDAKKAKKNNERDAIAGGKLGLWGAVLGALLLGPFGFLAIGGVAFAAGFLISREANS